MKCFSRSRAAGLHTSARFSYLWHSDPNYDVITKDYRKSRFINQLSHEDKHAAQMSSLNSADGYSRSVGFTEKCSDLLFTCKRQPACRGDTVPCGSAGGQMLASCQLLRANALLPASSLPLQPGLVTVGTTADTALTK